MNREVEIEKINYPVALHTVDILVYSLEHTIFELLLGRKPNAKLFRLPGGFVDPNDNSTEDAALRELKEETGLTLGKSQLQYVSSFKIDDERYRNSVHKIITSFYIIPIKKYIINKYQASDDLEEIKIFKLPIKIKENKILFNFLTIGRFLKENMVPEHHDLVLAFIDHIQNSTIDLNKFT